MRFIDRVRIQVRAGDGGDGAVAWRREAHVPKGGPAGGDGGDGGDVWVVADAQLSTLIDLKYRQHHEAESGRPGAGASKNGRAGEDLLIRVPVGTAIYYEGEAGERPPWLDEQSDGIHVAPDDHTDELENVWIVDGRVIEAEAAQQDEAEPSQARAEL